MMADFRALCAELADAYLRTLEHINNSTWLGYEPSDDPLLQRARASLADEPPEPAPPADGEVAELMEGLRLISDGMSAIGHDSDSWFVARAAELLERQAVPACVVLKPSPELIETFKDALPGRIEPLLEECHPEPVPVSERLPGPEDCAPWPGEPNAGRWCWMASCVDNGWAWEQRTLGFLASFPQDFTHWLPAHALPLPSGEVE